MVKGEDPEEVSREANEDARASAISTFFDFPINYRRRWSPTRTFHDVRRAGVFTDLLLREREGGRYFYDRPPISDLNSPASVTQLEAAMDLKMI